MEWVNRYVHSRLSTITTKQLTWKMRDGQDQEQAIMADGNTTYASD